MHTARELVVGEVLVDGDGPEPVDVSVGVVQGNVNIGNDVRVALLLPHWVSVGAESAWRW